MSTIHTCTALYEDAEIGYGEAETAADAEIECRSYYVSGLYPEHLVTLERGEYTL